MPGNWNSGRRKTPTALKLLRGNPGKRRLGVEPTIAAVDETFDIPPPELDGNDRARAEWIRVAPLLRESGLATQAERSSLTALCLEWSAYLAAQDALRESRLVKGKNGKYRLSPQVAIADRALSNCHWLWNELGLTPSGRAKAAKVPTARPRTGSTATPQSKWNGVL
jgi:P27 family predicted phage terminase small subunit